MGSPFSGRRRYRQQDYSGGQWTFSKLFRYQLQRHPMPRYVICKAAGIRMTTGYRWISGAVPVSRTDPRVLRLIELVGLVPHTALVPFEEDPHGAETKDS